MYKVFFVNKTTHTYADTLEMFGLCTILEDSLHQLKKDERILIEDVGHGYKLTLKDTIDNDELKKIKYVQYYRYFKKTSLEKVDKDIVEFIDYQKEKDVANVYWDQIKKKVKNIDESNIQKPSKIYSNLTVLVTLKAVEVNNKLLRDNWKEDNFQENIRKIIDYYDALDGKNLLLCSKIRENYSMVQLFNPFCGKGVNNDKALGINVSGVKGIWHFEFLKIIGYYSASLPRIIEKDVKIFCAVPERIYWNDFKKINNKFDRLLSSKGDLVLYDILSILNYVINILIYSKEENDFLLNIRKQSAISGFQVGYFKDMGQVKSLANINFYRFPEWIDAKKIDDFINILNEHKTIIVKIGDDEILLSYRDFLSSGKFNDFVNFLIKYSVFLMQSVIKKRYFIKPFLISNLNILMTNLDKTKRISEVIQNEGFQNLSRAIRNATINAQYRGGKPYAVHYGMAQDLKRKSLNKKELVEYLSEFMGLYNQENARVCERKGNQSRKNITTKDIESIVALIDDYSSEIVGKLLLAYGYAKEDKEENN